MGDSKGNEGPLSFREVLASNSRRVKFRDLASSEGAGRVMRMSTLEKIMIEAIENILVRGAADPLLERDSFHEQTREALRRSIASYQSALHAQDEAQSAKAELERQVLALRAELEKQEKRLEEERKRWASLPLSEDALTKLEERLRNVLEKSSSSEAAKRLKSDIREVVDDVISEERKNLHASMNLDRDPVVEQLERRITKLNKALDEAEIELESAARGPVEDGVPSIYTSIQGLSRNATRYQEKEKLIRVVFVNNLRLRRREVSSEDLADIPPEMLVEVDASPVHLEPLTDESAY